MSARKHWKGKPSYLFESMVCIIFYGNETEQLHADFAFQFEFGNECITIENVSHFIICFNRYLVIQSMESEKKHFNMACSQVLNHLGIF